MAEFQTKIISGKQTPLTFVNSGVEILIVKPEYINLKKEDKIDFLNLISDWVKSELSLIQ